MTRPKRPRVAAIGLDNDQKDAITPLCGDLRTAGSLSKYLEKYSWTETDMVISGVAWRSDIAGGVHLLTIGPTHFRWPHSYFQGKYIWEEVHTDYKNTERELMVPKSCPVVYKPLADELSGQLSRAAEPPVVFKTPRVDGTALIETTSGSPVALQLGLADQSKTTHMRSRNPTALLLPESANLAAWLRIFLTELNKSDPDRFPFPPPRFSQRTDWYTPQERALADRIATTQQELERLRSEQERNQEKLAIEGENADRGIRRALWADGDDLVAAVQEIFSGLDFTVRDMDAERKEKGEQRREDLRLTLKGKPGWEAIPEVKGYPNATKTKDARQIREHRDQYLLEKKRKPDLTLWIANPYRKVLEPPFRPAPDESVERAAQSIETVHILVSDLYKQWALVAAGKIEAGVVVQRLIDAEPGLWTPP